MNDPATLEHLQNEVLRKIGRNVLNFQKMEAMLKVSIVHSHIHPVIPPIVERGKSIMRASLIANHKLKDLEHAANIITESVNKAIKETTEDEASLL